MPTLKNILLLFIGLSLTLLLPAQTGMENAEKPSAKAIQLSEQPLIDGEVISDPVWSKINTVGSLTQNTPNWGSGPSEKTDIRIAYTETTFYLSVVCYDAQPDKLIVSDARRNFIYQQFQFTIF